MKREEIALAVADRILEVSKENDVRDILIKHANIARPSGKTNLEEVLESFTNLAINADSEQVRSQSAIQYIKFLGKDKEEGSGGGNAPVALQININPVKAETTIE